MKTGWLLLILEGLSQFIPGLSLCSVWMEPTITHDKSPQQHSMMQLTSKPYYLAANRWATTMIITLTVYVWRIVSIKGILNPSPWILLRHRVTVQLNDMTPHVNTHSSSRGVCCDRKCCSGGSSEEWSWWEHWALMWSIGLITTLSTCYRETIMLSSNPLYGTLHDWKMRGSRPQATATNWPKWSRLSKRKGFVCCLKEAAA